MMVSFITAAQAREQLRIDSEADDGWLAIWIPVVSAAVASWLKEEWRRYVYEVDSDGDPLRDSDGRLVLALDSEGDPILQPAVVGATLVELASQYRYREGEGDNTVQSDAGYGYVLSRAATALLTPLRRSTVA